MDERLEWALEDTLTVKELIELLEKYPEKMKVITTWESTLNNLSKEDIYESKEGNLYFDADDCFYKKEFAKNPKENED